MIAQFTTFLYYVTHETEFVRGIWHPLLMAFMVRPMLINVIGIIRQRNKLRPKYYAAFLIYLFPLTVTFIVHTFYFFWELIFIGVVISTLSMFVIILYDQIAQYLRLQREIS